jgi:ribulose-5-phosphate 4-epimerase/fuculose-1-phosphate aldolase
MIAGRAIMIVKKRTVVQNWMAHTLGHASGSRNNDILTEKRRPHMNAPEKLMIQSLKEKVSPEEWQTRVDLAACYRLVADFGWSDLIFTHISARVPGTEDQFLINPYGMMFDEITASSLVKIDINGNKIEESPFPVNPAGFTIHSAIHSARHEAQCVLHVHSVNGVAVSAQKEGVLPLSQQSIFVLASLAYHDYEGVALNEEEKPRLVADLGRKTYLMLRNHGLLTVGKTIADAFQNMYIFEAACMIQIRAQAGGGELVRIPQAIIDGAQQQARKATNSQGGMLAWPGLLRRLDRIDQSFRH